MRGKDLVVTDLKTEFVSMQLACVVFVVQTVCAAFAVALGPPVLAQKLLRVSPRWLYTSFMTQDPPSPPPIGPSCLPAYAFYKAKCPGSRHDCEDSLCASALDSFKCCLKTTPLSPLEVPSTVVVPSNLTRWEGLQLTPHWVSIRRTLITRGEECEKKGFWPLNVCGVPDLPPIPPQQQISEEGQMEQIEREAERSLADIRERKEALMKDIDEFGFGDEVEELEGLEKEKQDILARVGSK